MLSRTKEWAKDEKERDRKEYMQYWYGTLHDFFQPHLFLLF